METGEKGDRTLAEKMVHWRSIALIGACICGAIVLSTMVIGTVPSMAGPVASATEELAIAAMDAPSTMTPTDSTEAPIEPIDSVVDDTIAPDPLAPAAVPAAPSAIVAAGGSSVTSPVPISPSPAAPSAPSAAAPTPTAAVPAPTTAAPTTAAPTTAAPTTAAPTTAAPTTTAGLTFPAYTVSGAANLSLQFDGSSIYVASLTPQANWVYEIAKNGPRSVEIKFFNVATGRDREFHAAVEGGRIKVES